MSTLVKEDLFENLLESAPANFTEARQTAKDLYLKSGLPAPKEEEYKFTGITKKARKKPR